MKSPENGRASTATRKPHAGGFVRAYYGAPVNIACKLRGDHQVVVTESTWSLLPDPVGDKGSITGYSVEGGLGLEFNDSYVAIEG